MNNYVVVGNGIASATVVQHLARIDYGAPITWIRGKKQHAYSKYGAVEHMSHSGKIDPAQCIPSSFFTQHNITFVNEPAVRIEQKRVYTPTQSYYFDNLCLAIGKQSLQTQKFVTDVSKIAHIKEIMHTPAKSVVLLGATAYALYLALHLAQNGVRVTIVEKNNHILDNVLPRHIADIIITYLRSFDISFVLNDQVVHFGGVNQQLSYVETFKKARYETQLCVHMDTYKINSDLLSKTGISVRNGIVVNEHMQTTHPDVFACGLCVDDAPCSWSVAKEMAQVAAYAMYGKPYVYMPSEPIYHCQLQQKTLFWIGNCNPQDRRVKVIEHINRYEKTFVCYYILDNVLIGASCFGKPFDAYAIKHFIDAQVPVQEAEFL